MPLTDSQIYGIVRACYNAMDDRMAPTFNTVSEENVKELNRLMWESVYSSLISTHPEYLQQIQANLKKLFEIIYGRFQTSPNQVNHFYVGQTLPFILD